MGDAVQIGFERMRRRGRAARRYRAAPRKPPQPQQYVGTPITPPPTPTKETLAAAWLAAGGVTPQQAKAFGDAGMKPPLPKPGDTSMREQGERTRRLEMGQEWGLNPQWAQFYAETGNLQQAAQNQRREQTNQMLSQAMQEEDEAEAIEKQRRQQWATAMIQRRFPNIDPQEAERMGGIASASRDINIGISRVISLFVTEKDKEEAARRKAEVAWRVGEPYKVRAGERVTERGRAARAFMAAERREAEERGEVRAITGEKRRAKLTRGERIETEKRGEARGIRREKRRAKAKRLTDREFRELRWLVQEKGADIVEDPWRGKPLTVKEKINKLLDVPEIKDYLEALPYEDKVELDELKRAIATRG